MIDAGPRGSHAPLADCRSSEVAERFLRGRSSITRESAFGERSGASTSRRPQCRDGLPPLKEKDMNTRRALNGLALALGATLAASALATTYRLPLPLKDTVELTAEERNQVAQLACIGPHNLQLVSAIGWVARRDRRDDLTASARCQSHRRVLGQPVVFEVNCDLVEQIRCDTSEEVLLARIDAEAFDIRVEHDVMTLERAFAIAGYLKRAGALQEVQPSEPVFPGSGPLVYVRITSSENGKTRLYVGTKLFALTGSDANDFQIESIE